MMNRRKRPVSLLVIFVLVAAWAVPALATSSDVGSPVFTFEKDAAGKTTTLLKYDGSEPTVLIPDKCGGLPVTKIGEGAFYGCSSMKAITFPASLKALGAGAFQDCTSLKEVTIPDGVEEIPDRLFLSCSSLEKVSLPSSVERLGEDAFQGCTNLKVVNIPDSVKEIPNALFLACKSLSELSLPAECEKIGSQAFEGCESLTLTVPSSVRTIGDNAFDEGVDPADYSKKIPGCASVELECVDSTTSIGKEAFQGCQLLKACFDGTEEDAARWLEGTGAPVKTEYTYLRFKDQGVIFKKLTEPVVQAVGAEDPAEKSIRVPATARANGEYTVRSIAGGAFASSTVMCVTLPVSLAEIENGAFPDDDVFRKGSADTGLHVDVAIAEWTQHALAQSLKDAGYTVWCSDGSYPKAEEEEPVAPAEPPVTPPQPVAETCTYCGSTAHASSDCPYNAEPEPTPEELCAICGEPHSTEACPYVIPVLPSVPSVTPLAPPAPAAPAPAPSPSASASASASEEQEPPEPSAYDLPAESLDMEDMEVWDIVHVEDARRLNGQFSFEARGNLVDLEQARESIRKWAEEAFDSEAAVTFESEKNTSRARAAESGIHTDDIAYVETRDGHTAMYDVVVRGDVRGGDGDGAASSLTQLVNIVRIIMMQGNAEDELDEEAEAASSSRMASKLNTASAAAESDLSVAQMSSRAGTRPSTSKKKLTDAQKEAADINGNGKVTITDAVQQVQFMQSPDPNGPVYPNGPKQTAWESDNMGLQGYMNARRWARLSSSYLARNTKDGLMRVEYVGDGVLVEDYDKDLKLTMSRTIPMELEKWGGFYSSSKYNYLIFGQDNDEESTKKEVVRIVQYSKNWKRIGSDSLYGANTTSPFLAGALRCTEHKGYVYVRTCHNMFTNKKEGIRHQANMLIVVREKDMKITDAETGVVWGTGIVSHSFNQFVLVDEDGKLVTLDHGDGNPRAITLRRYLAPAGDDKIIVGDGQSMEVETADIQEIVGGNGDNDTGCSLGGFAETENGYVSAYGYDGKGEQREPRNIYFAFTDRDLKKTVKTKLTTGEDVQVPMIVSTGLDGGYIMWAGKPDANRDRLLNYVRYDKNGKLGKTQTMVSAMSDCQPIEWNGKIIWYVTDESGPAFYTLPV